MSQPRILVTESHRFSARAAQILRACGELMLADLDRNNLIRAVADSDVLWVRLRTYIDIEIMAAAPRLRIIATPTTGLTHIDQEAAERRGVRVLSLRGETTMLKEVYATAEHTVGLMLALLRHIPAAHNHVLGGGWDRDRFAGAELHGRTVGIVGYGRLGKMVAQRLKAFGSRVVACDPHIVPGETDGIQLVPLAQLLGESDLVSLHVDLNGSTAGFFGSKQFALMRDGAWFINTARGELVDEFALLEALESGKLSGAALDVLAHEKSSGMKDHPLVVYAWMHNNLIITPHVGGCTRESMEKTEIYLAEKLRELLSDGLRTAERVTADCQ